MTVSFKTSSDTLQIICVYAPLGGRTCKKKDEFHETFMVELSKDSDDIPMIWGDMNGYVGARKTNYEGVHGNHGYVVLNNDGITLLDFCVANDLILVRS